MKATHPVWAVLITVVATFVQLIVGTAPVALLVDPEDVLYRPLGMIGITLASLGLVYLIRRFLGRQSWQGVGLTLSWRVAPQLLLGTAVAAGAVSTANALSVALGVAAWDGENTIAAQLPYLPLSIAFALLSQAFPEELLWRGHLFDTLSGRLSSRTVLIVVSVGFGVLHIISYSPADTPVERVLYVLPATALGFACAAARVRTQTLWMAVGVHLGFHLGEMLTPTHDIRYDAQLIILTGVLSLAGLLILVARRR
ncbi:CPBP family intramembrane glutamic endopeptidase [Nonomuraea sp. NPDC059007]|uniref:CPBP family intramembrane glutamic endopeptidase n=1 Tax=Nonomuraea sp. NPDC059007 TaxID=3346692 RepID=UPI00369BAC6C